jgi:hypothetical protein
VARYGAFRNLSLWCIANEVEVYPDNRYNSHEPDPEAYRWAADMAAHIQSIDPHRHLITVHHATMAYEGDIWKEFFQGRMAIIQQQKHGDVDQAPLPPQSQGGFADGVKTDGDAFGIEKWIDHDRQFGVPVVNGEYGYEYYRTNSGKRCDPIRLRFGTNWQRKGAWRVMMSGGYISAGYEATLKCPGFFLPGAEHEGAAQLGHLYRFLSALPFDQMEPHREMVNAPNLCFAKPGTVYAVYYIGRNLGGVASDGSITLNLTDGQGEFEAVWFDPREGTSRDSMKVSGGAIRKFTAPTQADDWTLLVKRSDAATSRTKP